MKDNEIEQIRALIEKQIGANMKGSRNPKEARRGLSFWFNNYNRSNGPIFSIRPSGLKRHIVSFKFGSYAVDCIKHIQDRASIEDYALAYAFTNQLKSLFDVSINGSTTTDRWQTSSDIEIKVTRKVSDLHGSQEILNTISLIMVPLVAAVAELIGYEEEKREEEHSIVEGGVKEYLVRKRERSPRNRLLCLSIHGEQCNVCGFIPHETYGKKLASILEVHHIEPLSEVGKPRAYNPEKDLIPLCPNCHRAIHKRVPALTPDELREEMNL
ncbi:HNH endonuclease [Pseudoalteromonas sp. MMG013]|uniref:HNH endonuclease n=1 Tax=Pseudoalteromonas sp. MMG013 TaxID=2822687 RepID=UPI001B38254B|nr:HNH endonuclease [Pseudoalteromonas sp. MMG013]MBQ4862676.1 HNH endonuclease [Pseudoalteromonas sp. MMG013]